MSAVRKADPWTESYRRKTLRAHEYFKLGWDTAKIASVMQVTEEKALKYVSIGRSQVRALPIPYEGVQ